MSGLAARLAEARRVIAALRSELAISAQRNAGAELRGYEQGLAEGKAYPGGGSVKCSLEGCKMPACALVSGRWYCLADLKRLAEALIREGGP